MTLHEACLFVLAIGIPLIALLLLPWKSWKCGLSGLSEVVEAARRPRRTGQKPPFRNPPPS